MQDPAQPWVGGDRGDLVVDLGRGSAGLAAGQGVGEFVECFEGFGQGLVEPDLLGGVQGR